MAAIISGEPVSGKSFSKPPLKLKEMISRAQGRRVVLDPLLHLTPGELIHHGRYGTVGVGLEPHQLAVTLTVWEQQLGRQFPRPSQPVHLDLFGFSTEPYEWDALMVDLKSRQTRQPSPWSAILYGASEQRVEQPILFPHAHVVRGRKRHIICIDTNMGQKSIDADGCELEWFVSLYQGNVLIAAEATPV